MSKRRLISPDVVNRSKFLKLSDKAKNLYFFLCINPDDDGFVEAYQVMLITQTSNIELQELADANFITILEDEVIHIKDFLVHNSITKDKYSESLYLEQYRTQLEIPLHYWETAQDIQKISERYPVDIEETSKRPPKLSKVKLSKVKLSKAKGSAEGEQPQSKPESSIEILKDENFLAQKQQDYPSVNVKFQAQKAINWLEQEGKRKKNYKAFFDNWLTSPYLDASKAPPPPIVNPPPDMTDADMEF